jgi:hypothetical protein
MGLDIIADENEYEVAGVVKAARHLLLVNAEEKPGFAFTGVCFRAGKEDAFPRDVALAVSPAD